MLRRCFAVVALALLAGGCQGPVVRPDPVPVSSPTIAPVGEPVAFHLRLDTGQRLIMRSAGSGACPGLDARVDLGARRAVRLAAYATTCSTDDNGRIGNGSHGVYRTATDVPADRRATATTVQTALGAGIAFSQQYYECTNSCSHYTEPVAVITLDHPADPAFPTLTIISEKRTIDLDQMTAVLREQLAA
ncbi:hypothetical protein KZZ52_13380 [Dactylosporangium sp. AC04546]|uniref:hypothetical protein n=1 Tax=Dactylosporangium sp. AC04546 TaxID=2862460 RepID=UPI001EE079EB|nr:hypothetical protein [Dactylosporangium sp. AC04546]WVK86319.1 hypothetical protein KZZ52_13380 [Dactylosporangium sp. AC04546]